MHRPGNSGDQHDAMDPLDRLQKLQHMGVQIVLVCSAVMDTLLAEFVYYHADRFLPYLGVRLIKDFDYIMPPLNDSGKFEPYYLGTVYIWLSAQLFCYTQCFVASFVPITVFRCCYCFDVNASRVFRGRGYSVHRT